MTTDSNDLSVFLNGLFSNISNSSDDVRKFAIDFMRETTDFVRVETEIVSASEIVVLIKPSFGLVNLNDLLFRYISDKDSGKVRVSVGKKYFNAECLENIRHTIKETLKNERNTQ